MKFQHLYFVALIALLASCSSSKHATDDFDAHLLPEVEVSGADVQYNPSFHLKNDILHTKLQVSFDWRKQHLNGIANLTIKPYFYPTNKLRLDAKGFLIEGIWLINEGGKKLLKFDYDTLEINIELDRTYTREENYEIEIVYTARPNELDSEGSLAITSDKGLYFINPLGEDSSKPQQIWTQGETEASSCWFPTIDKPNEKTSQEIFITVEDRFKTLSNGAFMSTVKNEDGTRTDHWKQEKPHAPYLFMMAIGDFSVTEDKWRNLVVNYYLEKDYGKHAQQIFGNTPEMLEFYSNVLKYDYPWDKYSQVVVRDFVSGAMENTSATIHFEGLNLSSRDLLDRTHEDIIAHEVVHQWFGDIVTCESWANLPLNESFATYGEYLWFEYKYGRDKADYHIYRDMRAYMNEAKSEVKQLIRYYHEDKENMFDAHSYQKGGRVLHMLRKYVGDDAFFAGLNKYLKDNEFKAVEIHQLRLAFEEITGEDLNWFFNQWFLSDGHPNLTIAYSWDDSLNIMSVNTEYDKVGNEQHKYRMPIAIDLYFGEDVQRHLVQIYEFKETFNFPCNSKPDLVNVDAEKMLLCNKDDQKDIESYKFQLANAPLYLDRREAVAALKDKQEEMPKLKNQIASALEDPFWGIRGFALRELEVKKEDEALVARIKRLTKNDPEAAVRSTAINTLTELADSTLLPFILSCKGDSSYSVVSAVLKAVSHLDEASGVKLAEEMEHETNSQLISVVSGIFADNQTSDKEDYFETMINKTRSMGRYSLLSNYGDYLATSKPTVISNGVKTLQVIAINDQTWWIRYSATSAISRIKQELQAKIVDLEKEAKDQKATHSALAMETERNIEDIDSLITEIDKSLKEIKDAEDDERLSGIYESD